MWNDELSEEQVGEVLWKLAASEVLRSNYTFCQAVAQLPLPSSIKQETAVANGWAYFCALSVMSGFNTSRKVFDKSMGREWLTEMAGFLSQLAANEGHRIKINITVKE